MIRVPIVQPSIGLHTEDQEQRSTMAKIEPPLSSAVGYGVVIGLGFLFAYVFMPLMVLRSTNQWYSFGMILTTFVLKR